MKRIHFIPVIALAFIIASCQSLAEKVSGTYSGTYTISGQIDTTFATGGICVITPAGSNSVNFTLSGPSIPDVVIPDIAITQISQATILDLNNTMGGTAEIDGSITDAFLLTQLAFSYNDSLYDISYTGTKQ